MLVEPYVQVREFRAAPTLLDTMSLRGGMGSDAQDFELRNVLLRACGFGDNYVSSGGFQARRVVGEQRRGRIDNDGILWINPACCPVYNVESVAYGPTPSKVATITDPVWWVGGEGGLIGVETRDTPSRPLTRTTYGAGIPNTVLGASTTAGATQITVPDPSGIGPGTTLRIADPGAEETVTVGSDYTTGSMIVPLASPLVYAHTVEDGPGGTVGVSGLSDDLRLAFIQIATALLIRPDSTMEDSFPDTALTSSTRDPDPRREGQGLIVAAKSMLRSYRKVR